MIESLLTLALGGAVLLVALALAAVGLAAFALVTMLAVLIYREGVK